MVHKKKIPSVLLTIIAWIAGMCISIPINVFVILPSFIIPFNFILMIPIALFLGSVSWIIVYHFYDLIYKYHIR